IDTAEFEHACGAMGEVAKHGVRVGYNDVVTLAVGIQNLPAREQSIDIAEPALQHFDINPERHHIEPADFDTLPPVGRRVRVQIIPMKTLQANSVQLSEKIFCEQFFNDKIATQTVGRRA